MNLDRHSLSDFQRRCLAAVEEELATIGRGLEHEQVTKSDGPLGTETTFTARSGAVQIWIYDDDGAHLSNGDVDIRMEPDDYPDERTLIAHIVERFLTLIR